MVNAPRHRLAGDHYQTEALIKSSGLAWTMLRNSIYSNGLVQQAARMQP